MLLLTYKGVRDRNLREERSRPEAGVENRGHQQDADEAEPNVNPGRTGATTTTTAGSRPS